MSGPQNVTLTILPVSPEVHYYNEVFWHAIGIRKRGSSTQALSVVLSAASKYEGMPLKTQCGHALRVARLVLSHWGDFFYHG